MLGQTYFLMVTKRDQAKWVNLMMSRRSASILVIGLTAVMAALCFVDQPPSGGPRGAIVLRNVAGVVDVFGQSGAAILIILSGGALVFLIHRHF